MWRSGERDSVISNATARVTKQFKEIGTVGYNYYRYSLKHLDAYPSTRLRAV